MVANGQRPIEVGIIGREGMTGLSVVLDNNDRAAHETFIQMAGRGRRIPRGELEERACPTSTLFQHQTSKMTGVICV
jgi:hypothetical protein